MRRLGRRQRRDWKVVFRRVRKQAQVQMHTARLLLGFACESSALAWRKMTDNLRIARLVRYLTTSLSLHPIFGGLELHRHVVPRSVKHVSL
jgi:hypothetical protein